MGVHLKDQRQQPGKTGREAGERAGIQGKTSPRAGLGRTCASGHGNEPGGSEDLCLERETESENMQCLMLTYQKKKKKKVSRFHESKRNGEPFVFMQENGRFPHAVREHSSQRLPPPGLNSHLLPPPPLLGLHRLVTPPPRSGWAGTLLGLHLPYSQH